jgi:hypothetical protein
MAREILAELRSHFGDKMFETIVSFNTKIKEAASFGQPISEYDPASKGKKDFAGLAEEIIGTQVEQQRHEFVNSLADQLESISATADELLEAAKPSTVSIDSTRTERTETPVPVINEEKFTPAEEESFREFESGTEIQSLQDQTAEEPQAVAEEKSEVRESDIEVKLADYYGVTQTNDAAVFVTLYPRAQQVQIAGDFNNWQPEQTPMEKISESGVWKTKMNLATGRYRYRLVVDGQWQQDPYNEITESNPFGGLNSVLEVK